MASTKRSPHSTANVFQHGADQFHSTYFGARSDQLMFSSYPAHSLPSYHTDSDYLDGLEETEVFAGEEYLGQPFISSEEMPSTLHISYYRDFYPCSLKSVEEDIEAEEAAQNEIQNYHSLDYLGLSLGSSSIPSHSVDVADNPINFEQIQASCYPNQSSYTKKDDNLNSQMCRSWHSDHPAKNTKCSVGFGLVRDEKISIKSDMQSERSKSLHQKRIWHNPSKSDRHHNSNVSLSRRGSLSKNRAEISEISNSADELKSNSLPRRRREIHNDQTYSVASIKRKNMKTESQPIKKSSQSNCSSSVQEKNKRILDKYATLPRRRKGKENEAIKADITNIYHPQAKPVPRLKSSQMNVSPNANISTTNRSTKRSPSQINPLSKNIIPLGKTTSRVNSLNKENGGKSPIVSQRKNSVRSKRNVEVQVNLEWNPNDNSLNEQLQRVIEENDSLRKRLQAAEANAQDVEILRMEASELRRQAENERTEKEEIQLELEETSAKVKEMLSSLEGVEKEFTSRGESLLELDHQLKTTSDLNAELKQKLSFSDDLNVKLEQDLDKSLAAQKTLLQQVQNLEFEGREMVDFVVEEKNALSECLKEAEHEIRRLRIQIEQLTTKLTLKDEEARHMVRLAEERRKSFVSLQMEVQSSLITDDTSTEIPVSSSVDSSSFSSSTVLATLTTRLQDLSRHFSRAFVVPENEIENLLNEINSKVTFGIESGVSSTTFPNPVPDDVATQNFISAFRILDGPSLSETSVDESSEPDESYFSCNGSSTEEADDFVSSQVRQIESLLRRLLVLGFIAWQNIERVKSQTPKRNEVRSSPDEQTKQRKRFVSDVASLGSRLKLIAANLENSSLTEENPVLKTHSKIVSDVAKALNIKLREFESMNYNDKYEKSKSQSPGSPDSSVDDADQVVALVLKALENVPDIVSGCRTLKNLYAHLSRLSEDDQVPSRPPFFICSTTPTSQNGIL